MPPLWRIRLKQILVEIIILILLVLGSGLALVVAVGLFGWLCLDILRWLFNWAWGLLVRPCHQ